MSHALAAVRHDGRRPSVTPGYERFYGNKPWRGDRLRLQRELQPMITDCLSPLRGLSFFFNLILGLTPQAKCMSPLRGSPS